MDESELYQELKAINTALESLNGKNDSLVRTLSRIEGAMTNTENELTTTTKNTQANAQDINYLKETIQKLEGDEEKTHERIKVEVMKDVKLWIYAVGFLLIGKVVFDVVGGLLKQ